MTQRSNKVKHKQANNLLPKENPNVPIIEDTQLPSEDGSTTKTVDGEGTCAPDGTVTIHTKHHLGTGTGVTVKRVNERQCSATAKYTNSDSSNNSKASSIDRYQGWAQTRKPTFTVIKTCG